MKISRHLLPRCRGVNMPTWYAGAKILPVTRSQSQPTLPNVGKESAQRLERDCAPTHGAMDFKNTFLTLNTAETPGTQALSHRP